MYIFISMVIFVTYLRVAASCDGYQLVVNNITNCNNENTLKVGNLTVVLNENCTATTNGCISTKGYTTARLTYTIRKSRFPSITKRVDMCNLIKEDKLLKTVLTTLNFPVTCPVRPINRCETGKITDITSIKRELRFMSGTNNIIMNIHHGDSKSCINANFTVTKQ